ncbi:uncharacterized protein LOC110675156 [Aedes aegypti]|uniref:Uncharacterized protein n=1 Tax=Aedes aegypti TaxID=7159 RepID=A0A6I8TV61_AEDAE|nr:uncharacterized protein LOC110675156 [Aedes aegypti]
MVRFYKRRSERNNWPQSNLNAAIEAVKNGTPIRRASVVYQIPRATLKCYVNSVRPPQIQKLGGFSCVFTEAQESELLDYILFIEQSFYGITIKEIRKLAFDLAEKNGINHPFNKNFRKSFRKRHPQISLRSPEATSAARAQGFNRVAVDKFFDLYETITRSKNIPDHRIYNVDETSIVPVQSKRSKVLALRGRRQGGCLTSAERGVLSTACICMSATGHFIPPFVIFPRVRMTDRLKQGAPSGTIFACNPSGWTTSEVFNK